MIFFGFSEGLFSSPLGNGNLDNRSDQVNYLDEDRNGEPIGLITSWVTGNTKNGTFQLVLKHQPDGLKSADSDSEDGEIDVSVTWAIKISN